MSTNPRYTLSVNAKPNLDPGYPSLFPSQHWVAESRQSAMPIRAPNITRHAPPVPALQPSPSRLSLSARVPASPQMMSEMAKVRATNGEAAKDSSPRHAYHNLHAASVGGQYKSSHSPVSVGLIFPTL